MNKKELILMVAKDIMVAYKFMPEEKERIKPENAVDALGKLFSLMAKEVEKVYNATNG